MGAGRREARDEPIAAKDVARQISGAPKADGSGLIRLRFDKVVLRVAASLRAALRPDVPDGLTVLVTLTAPIRLAAKTAGALEATIRDLLARSSRKREWSGPVFGNDVRIRIVKSRRGPVEKVAVLVHPPEADAQELLDRAAALLE